MKKLENKIIGIKGAEPTTYAKLFQVCLDVPPQGGFTTTEMKTRLKVATALDKATDIIELEDADYEKLTTLVKDMKWGVYAQELVDMEDELLSVK